MHNLPTNEYSLLNAWKHYIQLGEYIELLHMKCMVVHPGLHQAHILLPVLVQFHIPSHKQCIGHYKVIVQTKNTIFLRPIGDFIV